MRTPFALSGSATDPDSDPLVHQWQQVDAGGVDGRRAGRPGQDRRPAVPHARRPPRADRVFPDLAQVVAGNTNAATGTCASTAAAAEEWLPTAAYASPLHFRLVTRDQKAVGGGVADDDVTLTVDTTTGPFRVTSQAAAASVVGGTTQAVTWTANTRRWPRT